ncbi:MAG TPA: hypothetical protein PLG59_04730 [bacterium]|nr:hypothetical protein [bacterium]HQO33942.1 hypothetical protein [bacterium]
MTISPQRIGPECPDISWVAVLNSRQGKYPQRGEEWIRATCDAVRDAHASGKGIISSLGLKTWEISLWAAGKVGAPVTLVLPHSKANPETLLEQIAEDYQIHPKHLTALLFPAPHGPHRPKADWPERDRLVVSFADEIWPVSLRPGGNLEALVQSGGKPVMETHRVAYHPMEDHPIQPIEQADLAPWTFPETWPYLTHWTHSFGGPWPGEKPADYYANLAQPGTGNPCSSPATLRRILEEKLLRGSASRMPGGQRAVAFTALPPGPAMETMRYRKRFQRWNYEPYGIALDRKMLLELGARPVTYESEGCKDRENLFVQGQRSGRADWSVEQEWRFPGDLGLSQFGPGQAVVIVRNPQDRGDFQAISPWPVQSLTDLGESRTISCKVKP